MPFRERPRHALRIGARLAPLPLFLLAACAPTQALIDPRQPIPVKLAEPPPYPIRLAEPAADELVVVVNHNAGVGNHAGLFIGHRLTDPAGSYLAVRSQERGWRGPALEDYVRYQMSDGPRIRIYRFALDRKAFDEIEARVVRDTWTPPLYCAVAVHNLIAGVGPFRDIAPAGWTTPAGLADRLDPLTRPPGMRGECTWADGEPC